MKKTPFLCLLAVLMMAACGSKQSDTVHSDAISNHKNAPGDSAIYGLACDGCTDSIIVFLPFSGGDPDTFDFIQAHQEHRLYGRPHIGDELAVIVNHQNRHEALMVIDLEALKATWCYMATPRLRKRDMQTREATEPIPDSVLKTLLEPREFSIRLKTDNTVTTHGGWHRPTTSDDAGPVEYPQLRRYTEWRVWNGRLILKADTISGFSKDGELPQTDTADIQLLMQDSLVLRFADHEQSYYRKQTE